MNKMIPVEYYPSIPREDIIPYTKHKYARRDLAGLGAAFAVVAAEIAKAAMNAPNQEGLYRCVFPEGVTGHLAAFKDGSGLLGTIMNEKGIAAQARWLPVEDASTVMAFDPVTLAVAVAIMSVNVKLDQIQKTQAEILQFLQQDKESELEGSINSLSDILEQYRFNADQSSWKNSKLTSVTGIKATAERNIIFYRKQITNILEKQKTIHSSHSAEKLKNEVEHQFRYLQLSTYLYAYSSFLEVLLSGNYSEEYLDHMSEKIRDYSTQYRLDYTACYDQLEKYMVDTVQAVAFNNIGKISKAAGETIEKIPVIRRGPVDEALISAGNKMKGFGEKKVKTAMNDFRTNSDAGIQFFLGNISTINELSNRPVEVFFDNDDIYICA